MEFHQKEIDEIKNRVEKNERKQREFNIRFWSLGFMKDKTAEENFTKILKDGFKYTDGEIKKIHIDTSHFLNKDKTALIVALTKRNQKHQIYGKMRNLKGLVKLSYGGQKGCMDDETDVVTDVKLDVWMMKRM